MELTNLFFDEYTDPTKDDVTGLAIASKNGYEYIARVYTLEGDFRGKTIDEERPYNMVIRPIDIKKFDYKPVKMIPSDPIYRLINS